MNKYYLKNKILENLKLQGFKIEDNKLKPKQNSKDTLRNIHNQSRNEKLKKHRKTLLNDTKIIEKYLIDGKNINPEKIKLKLIEVKPNSEESKIFFWWNLMWWSLPYERPIGRQMRFIVWDEYHNAPFGLIGLQSPPLRSALRDKFLGLNNGNNDFWINQSMYGQRIGALPPYNQLLGGKMIGLILVSREVRKAYEKKYLRGRTLLKNRKIPNNLLFITTTSAFGKSSIYDRLKLNGDYACEFLGFTSGSGTFHLREDLYKQVLNFLDEGDFNVKRGYGTGPSRKLKLVTSAFSKLGLPKFSYHNIQRGFYFFPLAKNIGDVIHKKKKPIWRDYSLDKLTNLWLERWGIPRAKRNKDWIKFSSKEFVNKSTNLLNSL